jgi:hypothetical protein
MSADVSGTDGRRLLDCLAHGSQRIGALREGDRRRLDVQLDNGIDAADHHRQHIAAPHRQRSRRDQAFPANLQDGAALTQHLHDPGEQLLPGPERQVSAPTGGPIAAGRLAAIRRRDRRHTGHFHRPILSTMCEMRLPAALLLACLTSASLAAAADTTLGSGVTLETATPIADVIAKPASFAGQTVRVEGVVTAVCEHMGCWMTLAPPARLASIRRRCASRSRTA